MNRYYCNKCFHLKLAFKMMLILLNSKMQRSLNKERRLHTSRQKNSQKSLDQSKMEVPSLILSHGTISDYQILLKELSHKWFKFRLTLQVKLDIIKSHIGRALDNSSNNSNFMNKVLKMRYIKRESNSMSIFNSKHGNYRRNRNLMCQYHNQKIRYKLTSLQGRDQKPTNKSVVKK